MGNCPVGSQKMASFDWTSSQMIRLFQQLLCNLTSFRVPTHPETRHPNSGKRFVRFLNDSSLWIATVPQFLKFLINSNLIQFYLVDIESYDIFDQFGANPPTLFLKQKSAKLLLNGNLMMKKAEIFI
jgi:hypothetical protein